MIFLVFSMITIHTDKDIEFSENILKISSYLQELYEQNQPLKLLKYTENEFNIFSAWFKILNIMLEYDIDKNDCPIFLEEFFKRYSVKDRLKLFDFAFYNQIRLMCDTIIYSFLNEDVDSSDKFVHRLLNEWKDRKYEPENNFYHLYFSDFRVFMANDEEREIKPEVYHKLYKIWKFKGLKFFTTDDFKNICNLLGLTTNVYGYDTEKKAIAEKIDTKEFLGNSEGAIKDTFKEFLYPFRDFYGFLSKIESDFLSELILAV